MPMQQQNASFARRYQTRVAQANVQCKDAPATLGQQRLPPGVKNGIARVQEMYVGEYKDDANGPNTKGLPFFRMACVAVFPHHTESGLRVAGIQTSKIVSLCDLPKKGWREATTFEQGYTEMQSMIRAFGIQPCPHTPQSDPSGLQIETYWFAAMKTICNPAKPRYIKFSTRSWTPAKPATWKEGDEVPEARTIENWEGVATDEEVAKMNGQYDPTAGAADAPSTTPHTTGPDGLPINPTLPTNAQIHAQSDNGAEAQSLEDEVTALVAIAMDDPNGETEDGAEAGRRLEQLAWDNGWEKAQTINAANWEEVGSMALSTPEEAAATYSGPAPTVGSKWKFCKRDSEGVNLKNRKGEDFPPQEVEVVTVNTDTKTCTLKTTKDGKDVTDIKTKKPVNAQWSWLE